MRHGSYNIRIILIISSSGEVKVLFLSVGFVDVRSIDDNEKTA